MPTPVHPNPLRDVFGDPLYAAGEQLVSAGSVREVRILQGGGVLTGVVGTARVYIRRAAGKIEGECSCAERGPCSHVVAVAIAAETTGPMPAPGAPRAIADTSPRPSPARNLAGQSQRLLYRLERTSNGIQVSAWVAQSAVENLHPFVVRASAGGAEFPRYVNDSDRNILQALASNAASITRADSPCELCGENGGRLLHQIIATGRAFWQSPHTRMLRSGEPRQARFSWKALSNGDQELRCEAGASAEVFLRIEPPTYIDPATAEVGPLESTQPLRLALRYWAKPAIAPENVAATNEQISREPEAAQFPLLQPVSVKQHPLSSLSARLVLSAGPTPALYFIYNGLPVHSDRLQTEHVTVRQLMNGVLHEIPRNHQLEQRLRARLSQLLPAGAQTRAAWLEFMLEAVAALEAENWEVSVADTFPYRLARADDWYGELESDRRQGWFNLRLGVVVDGQQVNLLPALARYLQTSLAADQPSLTVVTPVEPEPAIQAESGCRVGDRWLIALDDGRYLPIAIERIQRIANTLVELFDRDSLTRQNTLSLPRSHAGRIAQLSRELNGTALRAQTPDLRALLDDFESSGGIQPMHAPAHFRAQLRPYQQEGLGWLQFLRRHHLGGILADDMGLGKTVQTLAHLAIEKQHGRLRKATLIVAPVSTLGNWQQELHRFAPDLDVLVLHGSRRRESFALIDKMDVVITGYPLLQLDSEVLLAREFYLVILDEAQTIKNPRAKVSAVARALRAEHRLALTGTPVENHLGELWSLFDFALPGLLGEERHFQRHYRTPIEKDGNRLRAQALAKRVGPFLLRRTKDAVAKDLPPKTEIVETLALEERQRDFYDGIRLASHRQIQEVVRQQGLARSQITILDALLKLRQACCDPRLLPMAGGNDSIPSAKLEWLSNALPELIAEGRRVLLFSQFTSMLRLIEEAVTALGIPYCLLTGETRNRSDVIARFQSGAAPLFLISLKAGGTGLNLTAADTVIHYDPWWNPAVEAQATDRAHRIGQDKPVFVYKLIAQDTVEERIMQLQADKHTLASRLYTESGAIPSSWTAADIEALFAP
jgi:superfamily II DNA or RNA helicase